MSKKSSTRRTFLKCAAGAVAAPMIVSASALGRTATAPSNRVNVGLIGAGGRGKAHASMWPHFSEEMHLAAVADMNRNHRSDARKLITDLFGNDDRDYYDDYREILTRDDIDAVVIAIPDHWHALTAIAAARAGKNVYLEKPFSFSIAEGRAIVNEIKKSGVVFQHGTQQRSAEEYRIACQLALNGYLGEL